MPAAKPARKSSVKSAVKAIAKKKAGKSRAATAKPRVGLSNERDPKNLRACPKGHAFYKTSDCPTCPVCEATKVKAADGFLSKLGAPAYRALKSADLLTLKKLSKRSEAELLELHGMGPASLPALRAALKDEGLAFRENEAPAKSNPGKKLPKSSASAPRRK